MQREFYMDDSEMPTVGISDLFHVKPKGVVCSMFKERLCITERGQAVKCAGCVEAGREWIPTTERLPDEDVIVETRISDADGERNVTRLRRRGNLWYQADGSTYVYYAPTHWREAGR